MAPTPETMNLDENPTKQSLKDLLYQISTKITQKDQQQKLWELQSRLDLIADDKQLQALKDLQEEIDINFKDQLEALKQSVGGSDRLKTNVLADIKIVKPQLDKIKSGKATDADKEQAIQGIKQIRATINTGYAGMLSAEVKNEFIKATNEIEYVTANLENAAKYNEKVELNDGKKWWSDRRNERKADRSEAKADKTKSSIDRNGLHAAVCKLELSLGWNIAWENNYETQRTSKNEYTALTAEESATKMSQSIEAEVKKWSNKETVLWVIDQKVNEFAQKTLIEKAWWSQGAVDVAKFVWALWLWLKGLWAANDLFPGGFEWLVLKVGTAYAAYAWYGKYEQDILTKVKELTGLESKNITTQQSELSHRALESGWFKYGEALMDGILAMFNDKSSKALESYVIGNKEFNLAQFISDYSGVPVTIGATVSTNAAQKELLHSSMKTPTGNQYHHIAEMHKQIDNGKGSELQKAINEYLWGLSTTNSLTTIQSFNEAFTTYENIQKVRYNILKKAGYEMDLTMWDKRKKIDDIIKTSTHLTDDYTASSADNLALAKLLFLKPIVTESTELSKSETKQIDAFAVASWFDKLDSASKNSLYRAYLSLKNKTIWGIKLDPTHSFMGKSYPALILGNKQAVPFTLSSPSKWVIWFSDTFRKQNNTQIAPADPNLAIWFDQLFERAALFADIVDNFAGKWPLPQSVTKEDRSYKYFQYDQTRWMYFANDSSLLKSITTTTTSEKIFSSERLRSAWIDETTNMKSRLYWLNNSFTNKRDISKTQEIELPIWSVNYGLNPFEVWVKPENLARPEMRKYQSWSEALALRLKWHIDDVRNVGKVVGDATREWLIYVIKWWGILIKEGALTLVDAAWHTVNDKDRWLLKHTRTALLSISEIAVESVDKIITGLKDKEVFDKAINILWKWLVAVTSYTWVAIGELVSWLKGPLKDAVGWLMWAIAEAFPDDKEKAKAMAVMAWALVGIRFADDGLWWLLWDWAEKWVKS